VDVDRQLLIESAGGDSLPDIPLPEIPVPDVPPANVPLPEAHPDGSLGEKSTSPRVGEIAMGLASGLGLGSCVVCFLCSNLFYLGFDYYTCRKDFGSLKIYFI
jgi:hypothetical protein